MIARAYTVAFEGVTARPVEVQCAVTPGLPAFSIVGLPDKAVSEARDRVRTALSSMSIALPSKRITVNLSPADLPKEGSHFDLPIALGLLAALEIIPEDAVAGIVALGELSLDGGLVPVIGALPAAMAAAEALETSMIHSLAGLLDEGGISRARPFREPHHTASMAAIVGG
ncbi:MAG: magnesium chelatase domain-containing protein, partial [Alphaproteobacteria bacterium]